MNVIFNNIGESHNNSANHNYGFAQRRFDLAIISKVLEDLRGLPGAWAERWGLSGRKSAFVAPPLP